MTSFTAPMGSQLSAEFCQRGSLPYSCRGQISQADSVIAEHTEQEGCDVDKFGGKLIVISCSLRLPFFDFVACTSNSFSLLYLKEYRKQPTAVCYVILSTQYCDTSYQPHYCDNMDENARILVTTSSAFTDTPTKRHLQYTSDGDDEANDDDDDVKSYGRCSSDCTASSETVLPNTPEITRVESKAHNKLITNISKSSSKREVSLDMTTNHDPSGNACTPRTVENFADNHTKQRSSESDCLAPQGYRVKEGPVKWSVVRLLVVTFLAAYCMGTCQAARESKSTAQSRAHVAPSGFTHNASAQFSSSSSALRGPTTPNSADLAGFTPYLPMEHTPDEFDVPGDQEGDRQRGSKKGKVQSRQTSDEERLLDYLFRGPSTGDSYNPSARPVIDSGDTVNVMILLSLLHIKDLDVRSQILTTTGLLIMEWQDERLIWDPKNHNGMTEIIVEASKLWRPEFAVINGAEKIYEQYDQFRAVINHNGTVRWEPGGVFKTMCSIDITYYPFDEQKCELQFGAWSYHTTKMNLTHIEPSINMDTYKENGEWHVLGSGVRREEFAYDCCPNDKFANVHFVIRLRRRHTFYVLNVILPSIMTSVLLLSVFFCTPGQKVQIGVVVLLSFRIFLLNVTDSIPKTSDHIPLLGIYLTLTMAITTLSMVLTVFVLNLHHITDRPVPDWIQRLVLIYVARMLGMCSQASSYKRSNSSQSNSIKYGNPRQGASFFRRRPSPIMDADMTDEEQATIIEMANHNQTCCQGDNCPGDAYGQNRNKGSPKDDETSKSEDYSKDWKRLAEIFDRLFFWLFLIAILVSTLVLFHPLTLSSYGFTGPLGNV